MWQSLKINDVQYFTTLNINDTKQICVTLTDLTRIWRETLNIQDAINRFKDCNPKVESSEERIAEFMKELLEFSDSSSDVTLSISESCAMLNIIQTLIIKMSYHFILVKQDEVAIYLLPQVYRDITLPLMMVINELKHSQEKLCKLIEAKDLHLKEFELEGFQITRKNVITPKFSREEFEKGSKTGVAERINVGLRSISTIFTKDVNEVYPVFQKVALPLGAELPKAGLSIVNENKSNNEGVLNVKSKISAGKRSGKGNEETLLNKRIKPMKKIIL